MQSHLEAALLGQSSNINNTSNTNDDDESNCQEEETEDVEDFIDEVLIFLFHLSGLHVNLKNALFTRILSM